MASKAKRPGRWISPGLAAMGAALFWSALHEPAALTTASVTVWLLSTLAVCLLARAGFAMVVPALRLAVIMAVRALPPGGADK